MIIIIKSICHREKLAKFEVKMLDYNLISVVYFLILRDSGLVKLSYLISFRGWWVGKVFDLTQ